MVKLSQALNLWKNEFSDALDEIEAAHKAVGGKKRGRRHMTQRLNQAYVLAISSHFQKFCRDLHSESADILVTQSLPRPGDRQIAIILRNVLLEKRKLDRGNPHPGSIGDDFNRFGMLFWNEVNKPELQKTLEDLNVWRNAIAHQDFTKFPGDSVRVAQARKWRRGCDKLAVRFDVVMKDHLRVVSGVDPW